ncbi:MAG: AMP-binding protein, partial [Gammaproteobacteria bacterium]|nr:AMP-binding protein [Gammaproteobacteria bacterium]
MNTVAKVMWQPSATQIIDSHLTRFIAYAQEITHKQFNDYQSLHQWSVDHPDEFWKMVWAYCGVQYHRGWEEILVDGDKMPGAKWFVGSRLNYARNLLRHKGNRPAIIFRGENGARRELSFSEVRHQVAGLSGALQKAGLTTGDRVAAVLPNCPEAIVAMLATTSFGGIWSSCSPDFGIDGIVDRFGQIEPKILFICD